MNGPRAIMIWRRLFGYLPANLGSGRASFGAMLALTTMEIIHVRLAPALGGMTELLLKASVGAAVYVMAALVFDAAGARAALQQFASRRARRV